MSISASMRRRRTASANVTRIAVLYAGHRYEAPRFTDTRAHPRKRELLILSTNNMEDKKSLIFEKVAAIMAEVGPIAKDRKNTQQNYNFRGIDDLMNAISPVLASHNVFPVCTQITDIKDEHITSNKGAAGYRQVRRYTFRFYAKDGSFVETTADGEAIDYGDKGSNKAQSVAYREAMFKMFVIPFQNDDIENSDHNLKPAQRATAARPAAKTTGKPVDPVLAVKQKIAALSEKLAGKKLKGDDLIEFIKNRTELEVVPANFDTIIARLEALIDERNSK
ncbi:MAG: hypothetical protein E6Q97_08520 [Desulfurellales bacterium]|nr:MAG: hypothetical protein E6Q97_08520 [Desulfurellales bacterium]